MSYAIEVLKNALDKRTKAMMQAVSIADGGCIFSESIKSHYRTRYIEHERQVKDLEKALEVLGREEKTE